MNTNAADVMHGCVALSHADQDRITRTHPESAPTLWIVWYVLLREARDRRSLKIQLSDAILADRAKVSRRTVIKMRKLLAEVGLLTCHQFKSANSGNAATAYVLMPTVSPAISEQMIAAERDALPA